MNEYAPNLNNYALLIWIAATGYLAKFYAPDDDTGLLLHFVQFATWVVAAKTFKKGSWPWSHSNYVNGQELFVEADRSFQINKDVREACLLRDNKHPHINTAQFQRDAATNAYYDQVMLHSAWYSADGRRELRNWRAELNDAAWQWRDQQQRSYLSQVGQFDVNWARPTHNGTWIKPYSFASNYYTF